MYYLAEAFPALRRLRLPYNRDQMFMLMTAFNELMLAVEIYLAHSTSGTIVRNEWIPIVFGVLAAVFLGLAGIVAQRNNLLATWIAIPVLLASILVGALGVYFHVFRAFQPYAAAGSQANISLVVWAPPVIAPLTFVLAGALGFSALWGEVPVDSGRLLLFGKFELPLPFKKTSGLLFLVSLGMLATLISSVLDHARTNFSNPWLWVPTAAGILATVAALFLGFIDKPTRADILLYVAVMLGVILVAVAGMVLHILTNLGTSNTIVGERFLRGAPILAPLLFADIASIGILALLDPHDSAQKPDPP